MRQVKDLKAVAKILTLSAGMAIGAAQSATAADITIPAPIPEGIPQSTKDVNIPTTRAVPEHGRWYLRGDAGFALTDNGDSAIFADYNAVAAADVGDTGVVGLGAGVYFSPRLRGDITFEYRANADYASALAGAFYNETFDGTEFDQLEINTVLLMANLYYDWRRAGSPITPYIGGGIGIAIHSFNGSAPLPIESVRDEANAQLALAAMAGASIELDEAWKLDINYRYIYMGDAETSVNIWDSFNNVSERAETRVEDISAHEIRVGLRYDIF